LLYIITINVLIIISNNISLLFLIMTNNSFKQDQITEMLEEIEEEKDKDDQNNNYLKAIKVNV